MKKYFCFSAMICVLLAVFAFSADAIHSQAEDNAYKRQDDKKTETQNKNAKAIEARGVMGTMGAYYSLNASEINKGKRMTLGSVLKGVATVTVTYISGGSTLSATVIASMEPALKSLGLVGSINTKSDLESAYESAISELSTRIYETSAAIARYRSAWNPYRLIVLGHNSQYHGSGSSPSDPAHTISSYQPPDLNTDLPSFSCPDGSCGLTWSMPSSARMAHFAQCGTLEDPYDTWLKGCYEVFYTCNTEETARHQTKDCGLKKWVRTSQGWSQTACTSDYRECTQNQQLHSTPIVSENRISLCGAGDGSSLVVSPTPMPTPTDNTPNCSGCTSHCSSPCSCSTSGTCNGTVSYHACGVHETSVSGDHSLQASCSSTDSNGNYCTVTNFYACDGHSHTYPAPPTVSCGRSACTATVSSSTEHRVGPCSACGKSYWSCGSYASSNESRCRLRTCRYSSCGQSWRLCQGPKPDCSAPSRQGSKCWAQ